MPIRILDAATIGRIAAGEVVERPMSIAKELIENSLDAGATSITIEIRDGGIEYLRVTDNGCGIAPNEARLAFENHATSKLKSGDELTNILTLGFRGEALPSISAVSKVEMTTRQQGSDTGVRVRVEGGHFMDATEVGCPEGTTIVMRDIFFNTPVRKAFLKKPSYEMGLINELVSKLILGNPKVAMRLINNGKTLCHSYGDGSIVHAALAVYGRETASEMLQMDEAEGSLRIHGLIGVGDCARANRSEQSFFINGRLVRCQLLTHALEEACKGRVMIGMSPICALNLIIPPNSVDVNVHPNKLEVRFRDEPAVRASADALFARALAGDGMLNVKKLLDESKPIYEKPPIQFIDMSLQKPTPVLEKPTLVYEDDQFVEMEEEETKVSSKETVVSVQEPEQIQYIVQTLPDRSGQTLRESYAPPMPRVMMPSGTEQPGASGSEHAPKEEPALKIIGVAFNTYVFVELDKAVLIIDQHAAHERLLYEKYLSMIDTGNCAQQLLTPLVIHISKREQDLLIDNQTLLFELGFEVEPFGEQDIQLRSVPFSLGKSELTPLFLSMLDQLDQLKTATFERRRTDIIKYACKRAVKAGDRLNEEEILSLINDMMKSGAPPTCPHGRPVLKKITKAEIERSFRR